MTISEAALNKFPVVEYYLPVESEPGKVQILDRNKNNRAIWTDGAQWSAPDLLSQLTAAKEENERLKKEVSELKKMAIQFAPWYSVEHGYSMQSAEELYPIFIKQVYEVS